MLLSYPADGGGASLRSPLQEVVTADGYLPFMTGTWRSIEPGPDEFRADIPIRGGGGVLGQVKALTRRLADTYVSDGSQEIWLGFTDPEKWDLACTITAERGAWIELCLGGPSSTTGLATEVVDALSKYGFIDSWSTPGKAMAWTQDPPWNPDEISHVVGLALTLIGVEEAATLGVLIQPHRPWALKTLD